MAATSIAGPSHAPGDAAPQWRQFTFFDVENVSEVDENGASTSQVPKSIRELTPPILVAPTTLSSPIPASLIVASGSSITLLDRYLDVALSWTAWEGKGRTTAMMESGGILVVIGDEQGNRYPVLKIWDLTREQKRKKGAEALDNEAEVGKGLSRGPVLMRHVNIQHGQRPHPVSAAALTSNLSHLAIGLGDGTVLLYRHLVQSLTTSPTSLTAMPKARVIHESPEPITGLGFREPAYALTQGKMAANDYDRNPAYQPSLFVVTINRTLIASVSSRGGEPRVLDTLGGDLLCASMDSKKNEMIIARDDAIYLYGAEGRSSTLAYEGPKSAISVFREQLLITSPPFMPSAGSKSATVRQYVSKNGSGSSDIAKITIFDLQNKLISYSGTFKDGVRSVAAQWGGVFIFGGNGKLSRLDEQFIQTKLDALYRKNLFTLAISVAQNAGVDDAGIAEIHKRYADYLYDKGDFDTSMNQYIDTLGHLQPSYVIRKFLDAQRIHNLTAYLQSLHSHGLANPDHTTLLLNCYTKTSDHAALDKFLKAETHRADQGDGLDDLPFDLDTAIKVCRQAGFFEHASYLAKRYRRHQDYLRIQIEDAKKWGEALAYLRTLGPHAENMMIYGPTLLQHVPGETTDLLIQLCTGTLGQEEPKTSITDSKQMNGNGSSGPAVLSYLGYNKVAGIFTGEPSAAENDKAEVPTTKQAISNGDRTAPQPRNGSTSKSGQRSEGRRETRLSAFEARGPVQDEPRGIAPSPRQYFALFVDHQNLFVKFLESVALALWGFRIDATDPMATIGSAARPPAYRPIEDAERSAAPEEEDARAVGNTLLELYLTSTQSNTATVRELARTKALGLLQSSLSYDPMHALLLCSVNGFMEGSVRIWERLGMFEDVLRHYMDPGEVVENGGSGDGDKVFEALQIYGPDHHELYPLVLRWMTSSKPILEKHQHELPSVLADIDERRILPPLTVVQILSRNGVASVGVVKDWLREKVAETTQDIDSDRQLIDSYRTETASRLATLSSLSNPAAPETFQVTRCASCNAQLDLPAVHFMCKHSYHQRCLSDSEPECVLCSRQHAIVKEVRRNQTRLADRHEVFMGEVQEADDGWAVITGGFGRGLMGLRVED